MKTTTLGRAAGYGALYLAAFVLIVLIQFPAAGPSTVSAGGLTLRTAPGPDGKGLRLAELSAAGLSLLFSERLPLRYLDASGKEHSAAPASASLGERGGNILFEDNSKLQVSVSSDGSVSWTLSTPVKVKSVELKFEHARGARILPPADDGLPRVSAGQLTYVLDGFAPGTELGELAMIVARGLPRPIVATPVASGQGSQGAQFLAQKAMDPAAWDSLIASWRDKAWAGLSGPALSADKALWKLQDGAERFDELSFMAYMAEAMRRGRTADAQAMVQTVCANHLEKISWMAVPYAGRSAAAMGAFEQQTLAEIKETERMVLAKDPALFWKSGLMPFLFDRAPYALAQEVLSLARSAEPSPTSIVQALRVLKAYLDTRNYLPEAENPFVKAQDLADRVIAPAVRKAGSAYFLETSSGGACDLLVGIETGMALIQLGEVSGKSIYTGIGQSLVAGALEKANADGSIPRQVSVRDGIAHAMAEMVGAETVYPLVASSPYYPKVVSFFK
ncbi:MAG TPA: hypothetical protein PLC54_00005, partial [Spirochaetales bacterium]|nr:hypothetical protein [Spirochaetales bacterium]